MTMELPELPKQNKKKEADFGVKFRHIIEKKNPNKDYAFELKHTRGKKTFPFSEVKEKQIVWANKIKKGAFIRVIGMNGEPDYIWMKGRQTYVVIKYPKNHYIITMESFIKEKEMTINSKSLTEKRASEISENLDCL